MLPSLGLLTLLLLLLCLCYRLLTGLLREKNMFILLFSVLFIIPWVLSNPLLCFLEFDPSYWTPLDVEFLCPGFAEMPMPFSPGPDCRSAPWACTGGGPIIFIRKEFSVVKGREPWCGESVAPRFWLRLDRHRGFNGLLPWFGGTKVDRFSWIFIIKAVPLVCGLGLLTLERDSLRILMFWGGCCRLASISAILSLYLPLKFSPSSTRYSGLRLIKFLVPKDLLVIINFFF